MEDWKKRLEELSFTKGYYFKLGDNGLVKKEDDQLIFNREVLEAFIKQELDKAREEGFDSGVKRTVDIVQKSLDELLLERGEDKYWVGDILRDCGTSIEKMLPREMQHYKSKLKSNKDE